MVDTEAERAVERKSRRVGRIDVEHSGGEPGSGEMLEPGDEEHPTEPPIGERRVDTDDVDLAERRRRGWVHLGPAGSSKLPVDLYDEKARRIEPGLLLACCQHREIPGTLFGVAGECSVVDCQPGNLVTADHERAQPRWGVCRRLGDGGASKGERYPELEEIAFYREPHSRCRFVSGVVPRRPVAEKTAPLMAHGIGGGLEQCGGRAGTAAPVRMDSHLERPSPVNAAELPVSSERSTLPMPAEQCDAAWTASVVEDRLLLFAQSRLVAGCLDCRQEGAHLDLVGRAEVRRGLDPVLTRRVDHGRRLTAGGLMPIEVASSGMGTPRTAKGRVRITLARLAEEYPGTASELCALDHEGPFQLLVATILSAQCTDARVNLVTPALFAAYPDPAALAAADPERLEGLIRSTGFFRSKAKSLTGMASALVASFDGTVPSAIEDLVTLPGVGRKTANVVRSVAFGLPGLPVDTHVQRLSHRLGLATSRDPEGIERELNACVPAAERGAFSLRLILHGRRICTARRPKCPDCVLSDFCPSATI